MNLRAQLHRSSQPLGVATATAIETRTAATAAGEAEVVAVAAAVAVEAARQCQLPIRPRRRLQERFGITDMVKEGGP